RQRIGARSPGPLLSAGPGRGPRSVKAVKWFRKSAEQGTDEAQLSLGLAYGGGQGVNKDYVQAYKWFDLAALQGNTNAVSARDQLSRLMTSEQLAQAGAVSRPRLIKFD